MTIKYLSSQMWQSSPPSPPPPQQLSHDWDNLRGAILLVVGNAHKNTYAFNKCSNVGRLSNTCSSYRCLQFWTQVSINCSSHVPSTTRATYLAKFYCLTLFTPMHEGWVSMFFLSIDLSHVRIQVTNKVVFLSPPCPCLLICTNKPSNIAKCNTTCLYLPTWIFFRYHERSMA